MLILKALCIVLLSIISTNIYAEKKIAPQSLINQFEPLNEICLSDDENKPEIASACDKRDAIYEKLTKQNWCLGPYNIAFPLRSWIKCSEMEKPELIRLFAMVGNKRLVTGDTVPATNVTFRLYLERPCQLQIQDSKDMRYFYQYAGGITRYGCWYPTLDNGFQIVYHNGTREKQLSWQTLPKANLNKDGSATITETDYDSETFIKKVYEKQFKDKQRERQFGVH